MPPKSKEAKGGKKRNPPAKTARSKVDAAGSQTKRKRLQLSETSSVIPDTASQTQSSILSADTHATSSGQMSQPMPSSRSTTADTTPAPDTSVPSTSSDEVFMVGGGEDLSQERF